MFGRKLFIVAKSFPRKQVPTKNFHEICLVENFLWSQNHFLENRFLLKMFIKFIWSKIFLWSQNHFLENRFILKIFIKFFWSKIFYGRKINSSKIGSYQQFLPNCLLENFFMVAKSFPWKQVPTNKFYQNFSVEKCLWLQNHFLEYRFLPNIFIKTLLVENCFVVEK